MKRLILVILAIVVSACATPEPRVHSNAGAYNNRGVTYVLIGQYDQAISDYTKAIEINPEFARAYNNRGVAYYFKGEYKKAWVDVSKAQSLGGQVNPEFLKALREASGRQE
jgi:tetratricopeptide (TPR) repeat protein